MASSRAALLAVLLGAAFPQGAHADDPLAPIVQCSMNKQHKALAYEGYAYTGDPNRIPARLSMICTVDNGLERHETVHGRDDVPAIALANAVVIVNSSTYRICGTATAVYEGGPTLTRTTCGVIPLPVP